MRLLSWWSRCSISSPRHLVPGAAPVSSRRLQALAADHGPALNHTVEYGSNTQSAIISGFQLSAIFGKPSPAKAAAPPNLHRRPSAHCFPARSFFGGFRTPATFTGSTARARPPSETLTETEHWALQLRSRFRLISPPLVPGAPCFRSGSPACQAAGIRPDRASKQNPHAGEQVCRGRLHDL